MSDEDSSVLLSPLPAEAERAICVVAAVRKVLAVIVEVAVEMPSVEEESRLMWWAPLSGGRSMSLHARCSFVPDVCDV